MSVATGFLRGLVFAGLTATSTVALAQSDSVVVTRAESGSSPGAPGKSIIFGHNLTPTTYTLKKGDWTLGNFVFGYGATDRLTIATSPWLMNSYNMYNAIVRARGRVDDNQEWSTQVAYFKTGRFYPDVYQMEAVSGSLTVRRDFTTNYSVNLSTNYMYFFDETIPFSLRREPQNNDAWQLSLTTLQEVRLPGRFGILVETGVLGLNYTYPEIHVGLSMNYRTSWFLAQLGVSQTTTAAAIKGVYTQRQAELGRMEPGRDYDWSMHPELHLQTFF